MNCQKKIPTEIISLLKENGIEPGESYYYAWPRDFSSSAGPRKGVIACQAITSFTVEAYVLCDTEVSVYLCNGMYILKREHPKIIPTLNLIGWERIPALPEVNNA